MWEHLEFCDHLESLAPRWALLDAPARETTRALAREFEGSFAELLDAASALCAT